MTDLQYADRIVQVLHDYCNDMFDTAEDAIVEIAEISDHYLTKKGEPCLRLQR